MEVLDCVPEHDLLITETLRQMPREEVVDQSIIGRGDLGGINEQGQFLIELLLGHTDCPCETFCCTAVAEQNTHPEFSMFVEEGSRPTATAMFSGSIHSELCVALIVHCVPLQMMICFLGMYQFNNMLHGIGKKQLMFKIKHFLNCKV